MKRYIPREKLSQKAKREQDKAQRGNWGPLNPVTRKTENKKAYNRKKSRQWSDDDPRAGILVA
ncbi:MAG: hypothetical protein Q4B48_02020 [Syntrophomonadaceae bacterium]|nr:hypothetical protein [Syntrophomonadaceae bacterium]